MAKKKVAAKKSTIKKPVKSAKPAKKAVKKAAKPSPKKIVKKAKPAKAAKPAVKAKAKKVAKPAAKKAVAKKSAVKAKAPAKAKAPTKTKAAAPAKSPVSAALIRPAAPVKKLNLTNFVTPLDDRLIVQLSGSERMTPGGLFIPDTVSDLSGNLHGVVVATGRGHFSKKGHLQPMDVQVGDKVVFAQYAGSKIKIQNEDLIILRESDVMGVVNK